MGTLHMNGQEFVVLPKAEYDRLIEGAGAPANAALDYTLAALGRDLKAAREHAGLSQVALAKKLKRTQAAVSGSEAGKIRVGADYVAKVLKICGLPADWKAPA